MKQTFLIFLLIVTGQIYPQTELTDSNNFSAGLTLGIPSGINPTLAYNFNDYTIAASGGFWFNGQGVRLDFAYPFIQTEDFIHSVSVTYGFIHTGMSESNSFFRHTFGKDWNPQNYSTSHYAGLTYKLNWSDFYFQAGPVWGNNEFKNPALLFWAGWLFEL